MSEVDPPDLTVAQWLAQHEETPQKAGAVLLAVIRGAGERVRLPATDRDEVVAEAASRALADGRAALRRALASTPLSAWARGCVRKVSLEAFRSRRKEKERLDDLSDRGPGPAVLAEIHEDVCIALALLASLPPPYGYVLYLQLVLGMTRAEIRDKLRGWRPVGLARVARILLEGREMVRVIQAGGEPRRRWPQRYYPKKNPWIGSHPPSVPSQA